MSNSKLSTWRNPLILLSSIGISNIGEWIYFLSLNLIVLAETGSPLAVSILYMMGPLAKLCTNFWAGSLIDRMNKRKMIIFLNAMRALLIALIPLSLSSMALVYMIVFLIHMANSMFDSSSMIYTTKLIPRQDRKRFNSFHSLVTSGAFLIGPSVAGIIYIITNPIVAIYVNSITLILSAIMIFLLPNLEIETDFTTNRSRNTRNLLKEDLRIVMKFNRENQYIMWIYLLFNFVMIVMATGVDSLEVAFAKIVLDLTDSEYTFLVTITGAGIAMGALINSIIIKRLSISLLIGLGTLLVSVGYLIYALSSGFVMAATGFFFIGFFTAFANAGYLTFYQNNIPVDVMGRIGSWYGIVEAIILLIITIVIGVAAQFFSVQIVVIIAVLMMIFASLILGIASLLPSKVKVYDT